MKLKEIFWIVAGIIVLIVATLFMKDLDRMEEIKSFFRRKKVEDDVNILKDKLAKEGASVASNDQQMVELAEKLREEKVSASEASDEQIKEFYNKLFHS
jgi:hypothetical protein